MKNVVLNYFKSGIIQLLYMFNVVIIKGEIFYNLHKTKSKTHSIAYNSKHIIKIEHQENKKKINTIIEELNLIKKLNNSKCVSCPKVISKGRLWNDQKYFIQERIIQKGRAKLADLFLSLIEQKSFGIYQGDFKWENVIFDGNIAYLVDYDQAQKNHNFIKMNNLEYINWIGQDFKKRRGHDFFSDKARNFDLNEIKALFKNGSFNLANCSVFKNQITTFTKSGLYHKLNREQIYIDGARDLSERKNALEKIHFKNNEKVLDVGCNFGILSHFLYKKGCLVTGCDMDSNVIEAAKIINNILGYKIEYRLLDIDYDSIPNRYDTIMLFSVLHHTKYINRNAKKIANKCNRIIIECKLKENGSKPVKGKWLRSGSWNNLNIDRLIAFLERLFPKFKFKNNFGKVDRDRYILSFDKIS